MQRAHNHTTVRVLRDMGVSVAIDDFGTGYSSLSYLRRLPVNRIKVDQLFVRELPNDAADRALTGAIIGLGRSLNLRVTAEGVERPQEICCAKANARSCRAFIFRRPCLQRSLWSGGAATLGQRAGKVKRTRKG